MTIENNLTLFCIYYLDKKVTLNEQFINSGLSRRTKKLKVKKLSPPFAAFLQPINATLWESTLWESEMRTGVINTGSTFPVKESTFPVNRKREQEREFFKKECMPENFLPLPKIWKISSKIYTKQHTSGKFSLFSVSKFRVRSIFLPHFSRVLTSPRPCSLGVVGQNI